MFKAPFSFDGRIRRIEYFLSGIVGGIVFSIAWALGIGTFILGAGMGSAGGSVFGLLIGLAALVASMWFSLAQGVKRLHDLDKSGWLILLMFVPIVNALFGLYMLFADGTVGPNQYGEDPKNRMPYQAQPSSVNVTVNVAREEVKVEKPVEAIRFVRGFFLLSLKINKTEKEINMKKVICSEKAPGAIGPYSQAIEANGMIFVSGQLPIDAATGKMAEGIEEQARQSLENIKHILEEAGLTMGNIVKTTVFLQDMSFFAGMNGVYATYFDGAFPARSAVAVKALPKDALVEIECIAVR